MLVASGLNFDGPVDAELYDPANGSWTPAGLRIDGRAFPALTLLADGKALLTGGEELGAFYTSSANIYDPTTQAWTVVGRLTIRRGSHTATLLPNGKVLVAGGFSGHEFLASAELGSRGQ